LSLLLDYLQMVQCRLCFLSLHHRRPSHLRRLFLAMHLRHHHPQ
jgi:hypothetical protein